MNQIRLFGLLLLMSISTIATVDAQETYPRYPLLELFTNTRCSICGAQDPGFTNRLEGYVGRYHMVSFYPGTPYSNCFFYQQNTSENQARRNFYPQFFGTPDVGINGTDFMSPNSVTTDVLDDITDGTTWLNIGVEESEGNNRDVIITTRNTGDGELEEGLLFAVIVEQEVEYDAPNGINVHHNVFREFLTAVEGDVVALAGTSNKSYSYSVDSDWEADQVYVVAWVIDPDNNAVINSGTKFDEVVSSTKDITVTQLELFPNPASEYVQLQIPDGNSGTLHVYDINGRQVFNSVANGGQSVNVTVGSWSPGLYMLEVIQGNSVARGRIEVVR